MTLKTHNRPETKTIQTFDIPESQVLTLSSGHQVHISNPCKIGVVRVEFFWASGSYHQEKPYVATMANDLLLSGNEQRTEFEVIEYLDYLGATHRTECGHVGSSVVIRASKKNILSVFKWVIENIHAATYPENEVESAKLVRAASLERQQKTPKYWSSRIALESLYGKDHTLGIHGDPIDYQKVTSENLNLFKKQHFDLEKMMLLVSGDSDDQLLHSFADALRPFPGTPLSIIQEQFTETFPQFEKPLMHPVDGTNQVNLHLAKHIKPKDQQERFGLTLLNLVLGGYFGSRLMQILREERGLTYGVGSYFKPAFNDYTWTISGDLKSETAEEAIRVVHEIFEDLKKNILPDDELNKIKQYYAGQFRGGFDGPFSMGGKYQHALYRGLDLSYYTTVLPGIWSVTAQEVNVLANNYLNPNSFIHVLSGDTPKQR